ncbi:hypothetical protein IWQ61_005064 [Dispira simplex]|nr:hypothetical protein IWQ61_005064 [Dispira simplex]
MATEWDPVDNADPDFEWDETLERVLQSAEESFFSTQQQVPHLNQPPLTHEHFSEALAEGPVETPPPEIRPFPRDNQLYNITRDTQGYPGSLIPHPFPALPETTHQGYSEPNRPEIATLKEELSKLREENRQLGLTKEELLTQKYTREGEIAIIRKRLVKSEAENTQLQESVNQLVNQHHREKEGLRNQLESELAQLRTDLEFKQQELIALQMTPVPTRSTVIMPSPASTSESSTHSRRPLPSADDFLDASAFYAPPEFRTTARSELQTTTPAVEVELTPSKPVVVSVGIMTDPWPQSPTPQREVQDSTELSQPDSTGQFGSTAPQSTSAGDPPSSAPALVAFTQLQHWYSFISKSCPFDRLNQTYFQLTQMLTRYQSVCLSSALARGIVAYIRTLVCDALAFIPRDHSKVRDFEPPAVDTSENEAVSVASMG